jgi:hypothetical protein
MSGVDDRLKEHCLGAPLERDSWKAVCLACHSRVPGNVLVCPSCGHDFREARHGDEERSLPPEGFAYSARADGVLFAGRVAALLSCVAISFFFVMAILAGKFIALLFGPLAFLQSLALYVVFTRVKDRPEP